MDDELLFRSLAGRTDGAEDTAVEAWRRAAPQNETRYQEVAHLLGLASRADAYRMSVEAPPAGRVVDASRGPISASSTRQVPVRRRRVWWGVAAAAVAVVALAVWNLRLAAPAARFGVEDFVTGPAETATVTLNDGSLVRLGPRSRFRIDDLQRGRTVSLVGRAYFAVAPQRGDPFRVRTPSGDITVLGTRFDLEVGAEDLKVLVLQGRVVLSSGGQLREVRTGEMGRIVNRTLPVVTPVAEMDSLVGWKGNFIAFQATPFREAAREIERQFGVRIVIADSELGQRTITSWFSGWTVDEVMEVVCGITHARCLNRSGVITVTPQPAGTVPQ